MKYTEEMILHSASGYSMPFEEKGGADVQMGLSYGRHTHPDSGEAFFNHGIDFNIKGYLLMAVASGRVSGISTGQGRGISLKFRYGDYEVTYADLASAFVNFGQKVSAGQVVAMSGDSFHMEVSFKGEELDPIEFLTMLYGNLRALEQSILSGGPSQTFSVNGIRTKFDKDQQEIEELLLRFFPFYMQDLKEGLYALPEHTAQSLLNVFSAGSSRNYFFETMPDLSNPLGLSSRAVPMAVKVQNLLVQDFLDYLSVRHGISLHGTDAGLKKNSMKVQ